MNKIKPYKNNHLLHRKLLLMMAEGHNQREDNQHQDQKASNHDHRLADHRYIGEMRKAKSYLLKIIASKNNIFNLANLNSTP